MPPCLLVPFIHPPIPPACVSFLSLSQCSLLHDGSGREMRPHSISVGLLKKTNVEKRNISKGTSTTAGFDVEVEHWRRSRIENRCGEDLSRKRHGERKGRTEKSWQTFSLSPSTSFLSFWEALYAFSPPSPFYVLYFFLLFPHPTIEYVHLAQLLLFFDRGGEKGIGTGLLCSTVLTPTSCMVYFSFEWSDIHMISCIPRRRRRISYSCRHMGVT